MAGEYPITSKRLQEINKGDITAAEKALFDEVDEFVRGLGKGGWALTTFILLGGNPNLYDNHNKRVGQPISGSIFTTDLAALFQQNQDSIENIVSKYR